MDAIMSVRSDRHTVMKNSAQAPIYWLVLQENPSYAMSEEWVSCYTQPKSVEIS